MNEFAECDCLPFSQCDSEVPGFTSTKRTSDEFARINYGEHSTTKMKGVKVEKE